MHIFDLFLLMFQEARSCPPPSARDPSPRATTTSTGPRATPKPGPRVPVTSTRPRAATTATSFVASRVESTASRASSSRAAASTQPSAPTRIARSSFSPSRLAHVGASGSSRGADRRVRKRRNRFEE